MSESFGEFIDPVVRRDPTRTAVFGDGVAISYGQLSRMADSLAAALVRMGIGVGDRVAILARNTPFYAAMAFGIARAGGVIVPLSVRSTSAELADLIDRSGAVLVFAESEFAPTLSPVLAARPGVRMVPVDGEQAGGLGDLIANGSARRPDLTIDPQSACIIMFTSGTTGKPKGVTVSHAHYTGLFRLQAAACQLRADDVLQLTLPLFHNGGFVGVMGAGFAVGAAVAHYQGSFDPVRVLTHARETGVTVALWIPTMLARLLGAPDELRALPALRVIQYGSMPMPADLLMKARKAFDAEFWQTYGTTDCGLIAVLEPRDQDRPGHLTGRVVPGVGVRIVDPEGRDVPVGGVGEIVVDAALGGMMGYWGNPEQTAQVIRDGRIHSGDMARREGDGFIALVGRADALIISGGENIYPVEVEDVLLTHPDIVEVSVLGVPDADLGQCVCAVAVLRAGARLDLAALRAFCAPHLAAFKHPRKLVLAAHLPRTPTGKVARPALEALIASAS